MTAGIILAEEGIMMTDLFPPPAMFAGGLAFNGRRGWVALPKLLRYRKTHGIMVKVRDGLDGRVNVDEMFSKPIDYDTYSKMNKRAALAEEILMKAGVKRDDLVTGTVMAGHPGGTVRIGELLDKD